MTLTEMDSDKPDEVCVDLLSIDGVALEEQPRLVNTWTSDFVYVLSVIGFVVDLGNFWRFPTTCYNNGGGAFLIPYFFFIIVIGIPLVCLELCLGQVFQTANLHVWDFVCPWIKGIGYTVILINLCIQSYYNTIIAWALHFALASLQSVLPWSSNSIVADNSTYFTRQVLHSDLSPGIHELGDIQTNLTPLLILVFVAVFASIYKGAHSIGKAVYITALLPYVLLLILFVRGIMMPGAFTGLKYLFRPNFRMLLTYKIWSQAAIQVFFSLGPGFGVLIAYASYSDKSGNRQNPRMYSIIVSLVNAATSLLCALVVYSGLGYLAEHKNVSMDSFAEHGQALVFVVYPELIAKVRAAPLFSFVFFLMVFLLGLDSVYAGIEGMHAAIASQFRLAHKHEYASRFLIISVCFLVSIPSITAGGKYFIDFMDTFGVSPSIMVVVFLEVTAVAYFYGPERLQRKIIEELGVGAKPGKLFAYTWKYIVPPIILILCLTTSVFLDIPPDFFGPAEITKKAKRFGYALNFCTLLPIPIYATCKYLAVRKQKSAGTKLEQSVSTD